MRGDLMPPGQMADNLRVMTGKMRRSEQGRLYMRLRQQWKDALQSLMTDLQLTHRIYGISIFQGHVEFFDIKTQQDGRLHRLDSFMI